MRPIRGAGRVAMLDRVVVDVIEVEAVVRFVPHDPLPVASLPDAAFGFAPASFRQAFDLRQRPRERGLDVPPPGSDVVIARRQPPQAMQMIGEYDIGLHGERPRLFGLGKRVAQRVDVVGQQGAPAFQQVDREEVGAPRHPDASVVGHGRSIAIGPSRRNRKTMLHRVRVYGGIRLPATSWRVKTRPPRTIRRTGLDPPQTKPQIRERR